MFPAFYLNRASLLQYGRFAIVFIAFGAHSLGALAQNPPKNLAQEQLPTTTALEQTERERIAKERQILGVQLDQQRQACYQQFAVTPCLDEARSRYNTQMRDLKRQEVSLNDAQRRRAGADRLRAIEERNSNEAQLAQAQRRGKALDTSAKREAQRLDQESNRQSQSSASKPEQSSVDRSSLASRNDASKNNQQRSAAPFRAPKTKSAPDAAQIERNRLQASQRELDAQKRRDKIKERESKRSKPAAAPLPVPSLKPAP